MGYTTIENFSAGVDRRRPQYAGVAGSLWEGINGNLSRGGDFEKRKAFVSKYALPAGTFGCAATESALYVFGSAASPVGLPAGVTYSRLQHPDSTPVMTAILWVELFDGLLYVIAEYDNGDIMHFYNGTLVADWVAGLVRAGMTNNAGIAAHLAALIQLDTTYTTSVLGAVITVEAAVAGVPFTISSSTENVTGGTDDQTAVVAETVANVTGVAETLSTVSFAITAGTNNAGVNALNSITIAGVEVLGAVIDWVTSNNTTAANIATQINTYNSVPEYTATANGQTVTISAAAGTGDGPNGFTVVIDPIGDVGVDGAGAGVNATKNMAGGVDAVAGQAQEATVTIGGTFEAGDRFTITIDGKRFGSSGNPRNKGTIALTHKNKVSSPAGSVVNFSGVSQPTLWNSVEDPGAGSINAATNSAGSATVTGLGVYQDRLAIFSARTVQIWLFDEDPELNAILQTLRNTGTQSPKSVVAFSDADVFYLDSFGIRSLRARDSSNSALVAGVGALIDPYVIAYLKTLTSAQIEAACAVIDPEEGRFMLALGTKVFVFSYFPETKISGWSWYEPGFQITEFAVYLGRLYCRSGNTIYLYGGDDNETYDTSMVTCFLPFLQMGKDGTYKQVYGIDIAATNTWDAVLHVDPRDENQVVQLGELPGFTYNDEDTGGLGHFTHVAPKLTCDKAGFASLSKVTLYFEGGDESGAG